MPTTGRAGALALIGAGGALAAWFALYASAPASGLSDIDNPAASLRFLRQHSELSTFEGLALLVGSVLLLIGILALWDALSGRVGTLALRTITAFGLVGALSFFLLGVVRFSVGPLLYIDTLRGEWGEAAYLAVLIMGTHGFLQSGLYAMSLWVASLSLIGARRRVLPLALCAVGLLPLGRVVFSPLGGLLEFGGLGDIAWVVLLLSIPVTMIWPLLVGLVMLRRSMRAG